jgi:hypothetical protein
MADWWKGRVAEQLHQGQPTKLREIQVHDLRVARQVRHDEYSLVLITPNEGEDVPVGQVQELDAPPPEGTIPLAQRDQPLHEPQNGARVVLLRFDVDGGVVIFGIDDEGEMELLGMRPREPGVAIRAPLHRGADTVAVPEIDIVAHPALVTRYM